MKQAQEIIDRAWPNQWPAFAPHFEQLAQADGGRHWQHTRRVVKAVEALLNNAGRPNLPPEIAHRIQTQFRTTPPAPKLLRAVALLHDIGKSANLENHEEKSYRLFCQITAGASTPGTGQTMAAILIRRHAALGSLQTGETSPLFLHQLINDVRRCKLNPQQFFSNLIYITVADWAAYQMLTPAALEHFLATIEYLGQKKLWCAEESRIKQQLWLYATNNTAKRVEHLLTFSYLDSPPAPGDCANAKKAVVSTGIAWPEFKRRFALLRFDGGYSVFARSLKLTGSATRQLKFAIPHLVNWLPACPPTAFKIKPPPALHQVNFRGIKKLSERSNLNQLEKILNTVDVVPENDASR